WVAQVVEQIVAIPAGTPGANLDQPRPDLLGRCADGNRPRGVERRLQHVVIARQSTAQFVIGGTPAQLHRAEYAKVQAHGAKPGDGAAYSGKQLRPRHLEPFTGHCLALRGLLRNPARWSFPTLPG